MKLAEPPKIGTALLGLILLPVAVVIVAVLISAFAGSTVLLDERAAIPAGGWKVWTFQIDKPADITLEYSGVRDTAKGFSLYTMEAEDAKSFAPGTPAAYFPTLSNTATSQGTMKGKLMPGRYSLVIVNDQNFLNSLETNVKISAR